MNAKTNILALAYLLSANAFAQESATFVVSANQIVKAESVYNNFAKFSFSKKIYDRLIPEKITIFCRLLNDNQPEALIVAGQLYAKMKKAKIELRVCGALNEPTNCTINNFDELLYKDTVWAFNSYWDSDALISKGIWISNGLTYINDRKAEEPLLENIPEIKLYNPRIHSPQSIPSANNIYCFASKDGKTFSLE